MELSEYNKYFRARKLLLTNVKEEVDADHQLNITLYSSYNPKNNDRSVELNFTSSTKNLDDLMDDILYSLMHKKFGITLDTLTQKYPEFLI